MNESWYENAQSNGVWHLELHLSPVVAAASHMSEVLSSASPSFSADFLEEAQITCFSFGLFVDVWALIVLCIEDCFFGFGTPCDQLCSVSHHGHHVVLAATYPPIRPKILLPTPC